MITHERQASENLISAVARKIARKIVTEGDKYKRTSVSSEDIRTLLGPARHLRQNIDEEDRIGMANGLAWTESGGEVLDVEVALVPGTGQVQLTGTQIISRPYH